MKFNYEFDDCDFEYKVDSEDVRKALADIMINTLTIEQVEKVIQEREPDFELEDMSEKHLEKIIYDLDLEDFLEEEFEEYLYDYFEDDAGDAFKEAMNDYKDDEFIRSHRYE